MTATAWTCKKCGAVLGWVRGNAASLHVESGMQVVYRPREDRVTVTCPTCGEKQSFTREQPRKIA